MQLNQWKVCLSGSLNGLISGCLLNKSSSKKGFCSATAALKLEGLLNTTKIKHWNINSSWDGVLNWRMHLVHFPSL